jgi:uncharacterized protein YodC (DUF2158 family)
LLPPLFVDCTWSSSSRGSFGCMWFERLMVEPLLWENDQFRL